MTQLIIAALVWIAIHLGLAGTTLRDAVVGRVGDQPFRGIFPSCRLLRWCSSCGHGAPPALRRFGSRPIGCDGC